MVLYQFFSFVAPEEQPLVNSSDLTSFKLPEIKTNDATYLIKVDYPDPFSGNYAEEESLESNETVPDQVQEPIEEPLPEPIIWPSISFKGMVSDNKNQIKVFIVEVKGKSITMKIGGTHQEVTLFSGDRKSVTLGYLDEKKVFTLKP
jgi:hypothetical protein